jgi:hypothetical protein
MNNRKPTGPIILRARIFAVLAAGILLIPSAPAQQSIDSRYLLIFDTSSDMKKRVTAAQKALNNLFVTGMNGQLQPGDSIGVWTFDQDLRMGQFPLQYWVPSEAATMTANINDFVEKRHYSQTTRFEALQPMLNRLAQSSERLTVLIFCDGETAVSGTPFDAGINQIFRQRQAGQKKARQPFVIVMRVQLGQFVGCMVDFPPAQVEFPQFPPLPAPPPAPTNQLPAPPAPPVVIVPSLIITGTHVSTDEITNEVTNPQPPVLKPTNIPPPVAPVIQTNVAVALPVTPIKMIAQTNTPASPPKNSGLGSGSELAIGSVFSVAAVALGIFAWRRGHKSGSSLITRSMNKD